MLQAAMLHPEWVLGFIDGEGCFHIAVQKNRSMRLGVQVQLQFAITQHIQDHELMTRFVPFFNGVGQVTKDGDGKYQYRIRSMDHLENELFPFLEKYPLRSKKSIDFNHFLTVHGMMRKGLHLTPEGLAQIEVIRSQMNRQRMR